MSEPDDPRIANAVSALRARFGIELPRLLGALRALGDGRWHEPNEIIHLSGISYRSLKAALEAMGDAVEEQRGAIRLHPELAVAVLQAAARGQPPEMPIGNLVEAAVRAEHIARASTSLLSDIGSLVTDAPPPLPELDHVTATPLTVLKRAEFMASSFDLGDASVLFLGDHDLTSLALARVAPAARIGVADRDQRLLDFISSAAGDPGKLSCVFADFRLGPSKSLAGQFDIVVTDPPYSPDGVRIFLARAIQALKPADCSRILLCYGFSDRTPELGYNVQEVVSQLRLVVEAIFPGFNRYERAPALGDRSDLYLLRPTRRSLPAADAVKAEYRIYTKGAASREAAEFSISPTVLAALGNVLSDPHQRLPRVGFGWSAVKAVPLADFIKAIQSPWRPPFANPPFADGAIVSLLPDFADYLPRILLLSGARRLAFLIGRAGLARHASLGCESGLNRLIALRYRLVQQLPAGEGSVEIAIYERAATAATELEKGLSYILDRPGAKLLNAWREALIETTKSAERSLTKNQARDLIDAAALARRHRQSHLIDLSDSDLGSLPEAVGQTLDAGKALVRAR